MVDIKLYKMIKRKREDHLFSCDEMDTTWTITPSNDVVLIESESDATYYNTTYCIPYHISEMSLHTLFHVMYNHLPSKELEEVLYKNEWLNELFMEWLKGSGANEKKW